MTNPALITLDQDELLQLAHNAGARNDAATAIGLLKEAVSRADATAIAHYMLGAEYAEGGLHERAVDEMQAAIALDPGLSIARFQLGLLLLCLQQAGQAQQVLQPLAELGEGHPLNWFGSALRSLAEDRLTDALDQLEQGIVLNHDNPALNADMRRLAEEIAKAQQTVPRSHEEDGPGEAEGRHVLLSAYMGNTLG